MEQQPKALAKDYLVHPRDYHSYRWYKPILAGIVGGVIYLVLVALLLAAGFAASGGDHGFLEGLAGGYDNFNVYTPLGAFVTLGNIVLFIPAIFLTAHIIKDRPYSSYSSARGGWRMNVFGKCFVTALIVSALPIVVIQVLTEGKTSPAQFTLAGFILCTILGPLQCIAEEYFFRGYLFQTVGGWSKNLIVALVVSAAIFASMHPYNIYGVMEVGLSGLCMCIMATIGRGLEASAAIHITNNMSIFYLTGFGFGKIGSESGLSSLLTTAVIDIVYILVLCFVGTKRGWFEVSKKDDVTPFNERYDAKHPKKEELA